MEIAIERRCCSFYSPRKEKTIHTFLSAWKAWCACFWWECEVWYALTPCCIPRIPDVGIYSRERSRKFEMNEWFCLLVRLGIEMSWYLIPQNVQYVCSSPCELVISAWKSYSPGIYIKVWVWSCLKPAPCFDREYLLL